MSTAQNVPQRDGSPTLNWLIIEDGLKDFHGHFLDFITTFQQGLAALGDKVTVLCDRGATKTVIEQTGAVPCLPGSGLRLGSLRSPREIMKNFCWVGAFLAALARKTTLIDRSDVVFLTAVRLQHLVVWRLYALFRGRRFQTPLLFFFMATPVRLKADGSGYEWEGLPGRAIGALVRSLSASRARNKTRFATETEELSDALSRLCGVRFETMPQPVEFSLEPLKTRQASTRGELVTIGSFGPPREEKGSHLLLGAILLLLNRKSHGVRFIMQWTEDFECEDGSLAQIPAQLRSSERFRAITDYFKPGEYEKLLTEIDAIVLPYGSSYALRGSRVVIDALVRGLPVAVTAGTSMQTLAESYGKCVLIKAWDIPSIATALDELVRLVRATKESADQTAQEAREYFSVAEFRRRWLAGGL